MLRLAQRSVLGLELGLVALWLVLASILAVITAQVAYWNAMTDELVYERLAIAIGQTHSLLPTLHGEHMKSLAQVYPALISPFFWGGGYVPEALRNAHIFNAFLMSSACIPVFLLARRVAAPRWVAYALAALTICTPWIIYSTTVLTENAGYPAFMWALLGMHVAVARPGARNDALGVAGLALAFFSRQQLLFLAGVLPVALLCFELGRTSGPWRARVRTTALTAFREHKTLAAIYAGLGLAALGVIASGGNLYFLSVYGSQLTGNLFPSGTLGAITGHAADLAFGIGILPFVVGLAWLAANLVRPPAAREQHAFACVGTVTTAVLIWFIAAWDLHIGNFTLDRYLYYLVPLLLLATFCALLDRRRPRWSLAVLVALVAIGFATHLQEEFVWSGQFPLSTDSPISSVYRPLADLGGGTTGLSTILVVATLVLAGLFVLGDRLLSHRALVTIVGALLLVGFPLSTWRMFDQLFATNGHSSRPLTQSQSGVLDWLDRTVGTGSRVAQVPYPVSTNFEVSRQYWRDLEFWNKSLRYGVRYPTSDVYADAVIWFPNNDLAFDPSTGAASRTLSPYVVQSLGETRFRISGVVQRVEPQVMLIKAEQPWRTDWLTSGLYTDGWMKPGEPARIRVFATPQQRDARLRTLSLALRLPPGVSSGPYSLRTGRGAEDSVVPAAGSVRRQVEVCVPAGGFDDIELTSPLRTAIPGDAKGTETLNVPREGGLLVTEIALADELGPPCQPGRR